jgi:hypothetical protein
VKKTRPYLSILHVTQGTVPVAEEHWMPERHWVLSIAVSPAGDCIAAGTHGGKIYMWKERVEQSGCYIV